MTMVADLCSHTIRQKSANVSGMGPWNDDDWVDEKNCEEEMRKAK